MVSRAGHQDRAPGNPTTPGTRQDLAEVREDLEVLARYYLDDEASEAYAASVIAALHPHDRQVDQEALWAAFEELVEAVRLRDGVSTGEISWSDVDDRLTGSNRSEDAHDIACGRVDAAIAALLGGGR